MDPPTGQFAGHSCWRDANPKRRHRQAILAGGLEGVSVFVRVLASPDVIPWSREHMYAKFHPRGAMGDSLTPAERSHRMSLVRSKDTKPEMRVRRLLHGLGYRYRLHDRKIPGSPDLVFAARRKVIWAHGCFWHRHGRCKLARMPKSRLDFWQPKLEGNRQRDLRNRRRAHRQGWRSMVVWECETKRTEELRTRLIAFLDGSDAVD